MTDYFDEQFLSLPLIEIKFFLFIARYEKVLYAKIFLWPFGLPPSPLVLVIVVLTKTSLGITLFLSSSRGHNYLGVILLSSSCKGLWWPTTSLAFTCRSGLCKLLTVHHLTYNPLSQTYLTVLWPLIGRNSPQSCLKHCPTGL